MKEIVQTGTEPVSREGSLNLSRYHCSMAGKGYMSDSEELVVKGALSRSYLGLLFKSNSNYENFFKNTKDISLYYNS